MNKIVIITSDNRKLNFNKKNNYFELCALINFNYAIKNKSDFFYVRINDDLNLNKFNSAKEQLSGYARSVFSWKAVPWTKLLAIYYFLIKKYKYIIYVDSDCIFNNNKIKINKIIKVLNKKNILFYSDKPWNSNLPNSGFLLIKNNLFTKIFIKKWWNTFSFKNFFHPYEQYWLQKFWSNNLKFVLNKFILLPDEICRLKKKDQYIFHITGDQKNYNRIRFLSKYIKKNTININFLKKKIMKNYIQINPHEIDQLISKRKLFFFDKIITYFSYFYLLIKKFIYLIKKII
jgi:hypothetical protein